MIGKQNFWKRHGKNRGLLAAEQATSYLNSDRPDGRPQPDTSLEALAIYSTAIGDCLH